MNVLSISQQVDPHLNTLPRLLRAETLRAAFRAFEHRRNWDLGAHGVDLAHTLPSRRCVLRFQIEWRGPRPAQPDLPGPSPASELETVFGKVYESRDEVRQAWDTLNDLWQASRQHPGSLRIPQPLHCEVDLQTLWMACVHGTALTQSDIVLTPETFAKIGAGLARLQQGSVRVSGRQTLESDWQRLQVSADALAAAHPGQRRTVQEIVGRLRRHLPDLPRLPLVPSHGAFQLGHILCDEHGSLCLCDFDSMTAADPLFDVAHFTADMVLLEARGRLQPGRAVALSGALQQAWFAAVPWGRRQRVLDWSVAGLLLHKLACRQDEHLRGDAAVRMGTVMQEALSRTRRLDS